MENDSFLKKISDYFNSQYNLLVYHPLIDEIARGSLTKQQLIVFAEQFHHFLVEAEYRFSAVSVVRSPDLESVKRNLAHAIEEAGHMKLWLQFTHALGIEEADLEQTEPRPGVLNFTNYFYRLSFMASPGEVAAGAGLPEGMFAHQCERIAAGLASHYHFNEDQVAFFRVHAKADQEHVDLHFWRIAKHATDETAKAKIMRAAKLGFHYYKEMFDSIYEAARESS